MQTTSGNRFSFGPYRLDTVPPRLTRDGVEVDLGARQLALLCILVARAGETISKDALTAAVWQGLAVTTNSLDQAVHTLRRTVVLPTGTPCIETLPRRGYRFVAAVTLDRATRDDAARDDAAADEVLATHRAWIEGRAALETLEADAIHAARRAFEAVVIRQPSRATAHVGLAHACALQFDLTRTDAAPDVATLQVALQHAREARRLDPGYGEAWATLGIVVERCGQRDDAVAALREATALEPDNWRHHLRLGAASWGEERLREARRVLSLMPGLAMAHWLAASVLVARGALADAERELQHGLETPPAPRFTAVALYWLLGLLRLARGDDDGARHAWASELALEGTRHLYAREVAANTWYAIGASHFRAQALDEAHVAWLECVQRVPTHPLAWAALHGAGMAVPPAGLVSGAPGRLSSVDQAITAAVHRIAANGTSGCEAHAAAIERALVNAQGNGGWLVPVEPMLAVSLSPAAWSRVLTLLRHRAA